MQMAKSTKSTSKRRISGARRAATTRSSRAKRPTRGAKRTTGMKKSTGRSSQAKSRTTRTTGARATGRTSKARNARRSQAETRQKELDDLFFEGLKDVYTAEKQILRALPKMAKAAQSAELRQAMERHVEETRGQVERLNQVFEMAGKRPTGKKCPAIEGMIEEAQELMQEFKGSDALDAGLIADAQSVEHYEITRYGTLRTWAQQLGMQEAARLLEETLVEEKRTDELLTQLAEGRINREAAPEAAAA
jgi:ferritin-like metal-binding protein YciE